MCLMFFRNIIFSLLCLVFIMPSASYAEPKLDLSGLWLGVIDTISLPDIPGDTLYIKLKVTDGHGHLHLEFNSEKGFEPFTCEYYFRHNNGTVEFMIFRPESTGDVCNETGPKIEFLRLDTGTMTIFLEDHMFSNNNRFSLDLRHGLVAYDEQSTVPENFEILGIHLQDTRRYAETVLKNKGYTLRRDRTTLKGKGWQQRFGVYGRNRSVIYILYNVVSSNPDDNKQGEFVTLISRKVDLTRSSSDLNRNTLLRSIGKKYGEKDKQIKDLVRYYDPVGRYRQDAKGMICRHSVRQNVNIPFSSNLRNSGKTTVTAGCGSKVEVNVQSSKSTKIVRLYDVTLWNYDLLIENEWSKLAYELQFDVETFLDDLAQDKFNVDL